MSIFCKGDNKQSYPFFLNIYVLKLTSQSGRSPEEKVKGQGEANYITIYNQSGFFLVTSFSLHNYLSWSLSVFDF